MAGNLRDRLKRIQVMEKGRGAPATRKPPLSPPVSSALPGWESAGYLTLRREITGSERFVLPKPIPENAGMVMPGLGSAATYEDLLFFDLETSGLSGGAGTVAFLAAFGRLCTGGKAKTKTASYQLHITQYLLLDYPGEPDFIEALVREIKRGGNTIIVSYNGKSFDSQILKTRCLMNGISPPQYFHADLLHPSRRFWKRLLPDCSQGTIETNILGLDRTGDIPGAMAPEIWFSFLRDGAAEPLLGICEHNRKDIAGL
ncbi:MAG: ribonuclease H-like domain-containing protein, partial [Treponema sp.]|nr:ribonuclease H-like domain-containing protein [Treponema sp.]